MKPQHLKIGIVVSVVLLTTLFYFIPLKKNNNPMEGMAGKDSTPVDTTYTIEKYMVDFNTSLSEQDKQAVEKLSEAVENAKDTNKLAAYTDLVKFYSEKECPEISAYYVSKKVELVPQAASWDKAGNNFMMLFYDPMGPERIKKGLALKAVDCFQKATELAPENNDYKVKTAQCYMEGVGDVMAGVSLLREVEKADSNHIMMNFLLGKFGIISGQYEKAIKRLEKVLSSQSDNWEAYFLLAEAYANTGQKEKAKTLLNSVIKSSKSAEVTKAANDFLHNIK